MSDSDVVDQSAGVGARMDQADLTNGSVKDLLGLLDELVSVDRHRSDIAVLNQSATVTAGLGVVEVAVRVHPIGTSLEKSVTKNIARLVVNVLPNERNLLAIHVLESLGHDRSSIGALEASLGCVTAEISFHFDCLLPDYLDPDRSGQHPGCFPSPLEWACYCSAACQPSIH